MAVSIGGEVDTRWRPRQPGLGFRWWGVLAVLVVLCLLGGELLLGGDRGVVPLVHGLFSSVPA